ncbi:MAG TPA: serine protease [Candidatus Eremiobacteraceae bacterium]|nr:serine protease [Candidatus Eremiobacteraceae bacterium]
MPAVVRIDVADAGASGFIVSPDGWIITAAHVVFDHQTGERLTTVSVRLPDGSAPLARVFVDEESAIRDFAILKVEKSGLPFVELGSWGDVEPGSDITIIGFPLSAGTEPKITITNKFCLSGFVAATDTISKDKVEVDAIYFQGPAVKGISGGPLISRDMGRVIGIQSQTLAGISVGLDDVRNKILAVERQGYRMTQMGINPSQTFLDIINVLDRHLANGLGTATGADDVVTALAKAKRAYDKEHAYQK